MPACDDGSLNLACFSNDAEWLEADGRGGFASGTVSGERTRRYHALLLAATTTARIVLVNGFEAWLETSDGSIPLSTHRYLPDIVYPDIASQRSAFTAMPWPTWTFQLDHAITLTYEMFVAKASGETVLRWRLNGQLPGARLKVRLLLSGRDYHALHHENPVFCFTHHEVGGMEGMGSNISWHPYSDLPAIAALSNGVYTHAPDWYRHFLYRHEQERGLDFSEDLAAPGVFSFDLNARDAFIVLRVGEPLNEEAMAYASALARGEYARRVALGSRTRRAADAYFITRATRRTLIAGYPWFTDWGRDTFIGLRGLALATRRYAEAEALLLAWAKTLSQGMLPNRFPDDGSTPEYNAVDASLWFVIAIHDYLSTGHAGETTRITLQRAADAVLEGYARGTRYAIGVDADGLVSAGVAGVQLTWMDAKVDGHVITPRIGKPVEIQALWINALRISEGWTTQWQALEKRASRAFCERFTNPLTGALYDVIDVEHEAGRVDASVRPNQIFAVGGLPFAIVEGEAARRIVDQVRTQLLTPLGLRTLSPADPHYIGCYAGSPQQRDAAYHQGTVWPWLMGPFIEAWLRAGGDTPQTRETARRRFLAPLFTYTRRAGFGHLCEIADGDAPHTPRGAPFQAWSLGELLRIEARLAAAMSTSSVQPSCSVEKPSC